MSAVKCLMKTLARLACVAAAMGMIPCSVAQQVGATPDDHMDAGDRALSGDSPKFLSDSDPVYRYLETVQKRAYVDNPGAFRWTGDPKQFAAIRSVLNNLDSRTGARDAARDSKGNSYSSNYDKFVARLREPVATRYEDPISLMLFRDVVVQVADVIRIQAPGFVVPHIGTLPSGTLNARALVVPNSTTQLIVVNSSLFSFAHELVKIALNTVSIREEGDQILIDPSDTYFDSGPRRDQKLIVRLDKALWDLVNVRRIDGQALPRAVDDIMLAPMVQALEIFVVAHEFAHVVLNHGTRQRAPIVFDGSAAPQAHVEEILRSWGEEAVADLYAYDVLERIIVRGSQLGLVGSAPRDFREYLRFAPILFFQLLSIEEDAAYIHKHAAMPPAVSEEEKKAVIEFMQTALKYEVDLAGGQGRSSDRGRKAQVTFLDLRKVGSHPPAWARKVVMQSAWQIVTTISIDDMELGRRMSEHLNTLWNDLKPRWVERHKN